MKYWLIGADGMLGTEFAALLRKEKREFVATTEALVDITKEDEVVDFVNSLQITKIINCAAYTQVDLAETNREIAQKVNGDALTHLGKAAKKNGARILHFSTDYVFDGESTEPYKEEDFCSPMSIYGKTKHFGEERLLEESTDCSIVRTSWLFGVHGKNFVSTILRLLEERSSLAIVGDQWGRPTLAKDLAQASLKLFDLEERGVFHFANKEATSWYDFAKEIQRQAVEKGRLSFPKEITSITTEQFPTAAKRPKNSVLNTNKLEATIGSAYFRPWQIALEDYLTRQIEMEKSYASLAIT